MLVGKGRFYTALYFKEIKMVLLDNGHGYNTAGKRSPAWSDGTQLLEWEFNRDVVRRIYEKLTALRIPAHILVKEARDISLPVRIARVDNILRVYPDSFLISVHGNAGKGKGWEAWTAPEEDESDVIATHLYRAAGIHLPGRPMRCDWSDGDPDKESKFYILVKSMCPSVLTENLFFDTESDCRFMMSDPGREAIANLHVAGIVTYLKLAA